MAQRRYGPTRGAGVAVIETEGDKTLTPGALGFAAYAGIFEKGPIGAMVIAFNKKTFAKKMGGYIPESLVPDSCFDYYDLANGAGGLLLIRVTDGNELAASTPLYARIAGVRTQMGTLQAANGGRWGGKDKKFTGTFAGGLTATTLATLVATFKHDEWKGGILELSGVPNKTYAIVGNTAAGLITVSGDATMLADLGVSTDFKYYLTLTNVDANNPRGGNKALSYKVMDGEDNPNTEFKLQIFVDGTLVNTYANLNVDPSSGNYWVNVINNDGNNDEVFAIDLITGAYTAIQRPANHYGLSSVLTPTVLTAIIFEFLINGTGNPTFLLGTTNDTMEQQVITLTMTSATAFTAASNRFGALGAGTFGVAFASPNKWTPGFTVTAGGTPMVAAQTIAITYKPFKASSLIEGKLSPDKVNQKRVNFRIVANDHKTITVAAGSDLTVSGAVVAGAEFQVEAALELAGGRDGNSDIVDATYNQKAWDTALSPFNRTDGKNLGLVKFATPGITSTAVQKAGAAYALAKNHQYRYEVPSNIVDEASAEAYVDDTLGRTEYAVVIFPSYASVADPVSITPGKLKLVSITGMVQGREARIAVDFDGYHKAAAGIEAILPKILKIPTGDAILNEEFLNPVGLNVVKKVHGNFVIWGDRTLYLDPTWKFKHQRELLSYYEHVLQEGFDFIVFAINDPVTEKIALATLKAFFIPEFVKRAIRGKNFEDAAQIKIDSENNTNLTRANGDLFADIKLRLADTVERFIIRIGKSGIFDSVG